MNLISNFLNLILHLDKYLGAFITNYGTLTYLVLFLIILAETGLVVTPFLPGDSVIFASATFCALGLLNIYILVPLLLVAAIAGDTLNYSIGKFLGGKLLKNSKIIKKEYIEKTNAYYDKYGGKTLIIARFMPIIRTFAPFVAGIGTMKYKNFLTYNAIGGFVWVLLVSSLGYFFGNIKIVADNFSIVIMGIIVVSILPAIIGLLKSRFSSKVAV
ncbi:DedA family protein [Clostridium sp. LIBA-8841]|uniref:DedA family protein n=1 Tax=Clostridium sp. LIBA-8841 TaxID=2987530 RepID=UPI002AC7530D|nr:DedA family protein [Clostridium sp. LIBA-8841]MDZ5253505.1 DedA family protein [Clostridium sp. LIBA-8841]